MDAALPQATRRHTAASFIPVALELDTDAEWWTAQMGYEGLSRTTRCGRNHLHAEAPEPLTVRTSSRQRHTTTAPTSTSTAMLSRADSMHSAAERRSTTPSSLVPPLLLRTESALSGYSQTSEAKVKLRASELRQREVDVQRKQRAALLGGGVESQRTHNPHTLSRADLQALPQAVQLSLGCLPPVGESTPPPVLQPLI